MLPIAFLLPFLKANWKPFAAGLAIVAASGMIFHGCKAYRDTIARNAVLAAENEAANGTIRRWEQAEKERTRAAAEAARVADAAQKEGRRLDEAFSKTDDPVELVRRNDVARLFGLLSQRTALPPPT